MVHSLRLESDTCCDTAMSRRARRLNRVVAESNARYPSILQSPWIEPGGSMTATSGATCNEFLRPPALAGVA